MLRQKWGSVVCPSCRNLVGVNDERCFTCGRWNPGLWGFAPLLSRLGRDLGFTQFVMWIRQLAPAASEMYGPSRMVIIYTIAGVTGFAASTLSGAFIPFLGGAGFTVGASAPIFGLLGALVFYGRRTGSSIVGDQAKSWAVALFIFGFIFRGVDN